jgi:hypothetical protein
MKKNILFNWFFTVLFVLTVGSYFGCEKKTGETEITIPDLKGTWSGTFDGRSAVLDITDQTDSSFSGKISISYREPINQEVKGSFSPATMKITMTDQLQSRFQGIYNGSLSKVADSFSGTFTLNNDGSKYSFNLNKNKGS